MTAEEIERTAIELWDRNEDGLAKFVAWRDLGEITKEAYRLIARSNIFAVREKEGDS